MTCIITPVKTGMSIGTVAVYGLFNLTPKLRSPLKRSKINTPMCIKPTRAEKLRKLRISQLNF